MTVSIVKQTNDSITLQVTVKFNQSMLDSENTIQDTLNEAGNIATGALLKKFDTDGSNIIMGKIKMTSKGMEPKYYQTPYGEVQVRRHVYQTSKGGPTYCPLEYNARIILTSTPRFASQVSHKASEAAAATVAEDLSVNHNRQVAKALVQRLTETVSTVVQAKEEDWSYQIPNIEEDDVKTISIGLDGTCLLMCESAYRQAMVGTIALYDAEGKRQHTMYVAAAPEYGKEEFKERLLREIERTKQLYPKAYRIGIADGATDNWELLEKHTHKQILDFYHATEYLTKVADSMFTSSKERKAWLNERCHQLKHKKGAAMNILNELKRFKDKAVKNKGLESIDTAMTYFKNNNKKSRMNYAQSVLANQPIGSGVTEAACKTIVKQRLCQSGMRWKEKGVKVILSLRTLVKSTGRWSQFWNKVNQYGFPITV